MKADEEEGGGSAVITAGAGSFGMTDHFSAMFVTREGLLLLSKHYSLCRVSK